MQHLKAQSEGSTPEPTSPLLALNWVAQSSVAAELFSLTEEHDAAGAALAAVPPFLERRVLGMQ